MTYALVVGIEKYDQPGWDTEGPGANALAIAEWLLSAGIPPKNIVVFIDTVAQYDDRVRNLIDAGVDVRTPPTSPATWSAIDSYCFDQLPANMAGGSRLFFYWSGHGYTEDSTGQRYFVCRDYTDAALHNRVLNASLFLRHLRSPEFQSFSETLFIADVCAAKQNVRLKDPRGGPRDVGERKQLAYFATREGRWAHGEGGRGAFTDVVLAALKRASPWSSFEDFQGALDEELEKSGHEPYRLFCSNGTQEPLSDEIPLHSARVPSVVAEARYREWLYGQSAWLPDLYVGRDDRRILLSSLYVPLRCLVLSSPIPTDRRSNLPLDEVFDRRLVAVLGGAGSGKTTFLRHAALSLLSEPKRSALSTESQPDEELPFVVRAANLATYISNRRRAQDETLPTDEGSHEWLAHFLASASHEQRWGLPRSYIEMRLRRGRCSVLIDGLDEIVDRIERERVADIIGNAAAEYSTCRFLATSRPDTFPQDRFAAFALVEIADLGPREIGAFLTQWAKRFYSSNQRLAHDYLKLTKEALRTGESKELARTPILLSALAIVHKEERQIPRRRAQLYSLLVNWMLRSREKTGMRLPAEVGINALSRLALAMQCHPPSPLTAVHESEATRIIAPSFPPHLGDPTMVAAHFLREQTSQNGILLSEYPQVGFTHLSFQDFLAARRIADLQLGDQNTILWNQPERLYAPEWLETTRFLVGILSEVDQARSTNSLARLMTTVINSSGESIIRAASLLYTLEEDGYAPFLAQIDGVKGLARAAANALQSLPFDSVAEVVKIRAAEFCGRHIHPEIKMVPQSGGWFLMGAQSDEPGRRGFDRYARPSESPPHRVYVAPFQISADPVTVAHWAKFMEADGYRRQEFWTAGGFGRWTEPTGWLSQIDHPARPVTGVSWFEATAWCTWSDYRIPTESEWEYAAAGPRRRRFPWGFTEPMPNLACFGRRTRCVVPIGLFPEGATPEGVRDLAGNVWEWVADRFGVYESNEIRNPSGPDEGDDRVVRGGAWLNGANILRSTSRVRCRADSRYVAFGPIGFRVVPK